MVKPASRTSGGRAVVLTLGVSCEQGSSRSHRGLTSLIRAEVDPGGVGARQASRAEQIICDQDLALVSRGCQEPGLRHQDFALHYQFYCLSLVNRFTLKCCVVEQ